MALAGVINRKSKRAKVVALEADEQLQVMRYWVSEADRARRNIALIRGFDESWRRYSASKSLPSEIKLPSYNAAGRISLALLDNALDSVVLFSFKAFDEDARAASLPRLRKALQKNMATDGRLDGIAEEFRKFERREKSTLDGLRTLRKKSVAHVDYDFLLDPSRKNLAVEDALKAANRLVDLVALLAKLFQKIGTVGDPTAADNSIMVIPDKFSELDAEEFWRVTFSHWAK